MPGKKIVLIPVYNDGVSVRQLISRLETLPVDDLHVLLVNDGSTEAIPVITSDRFQVDILHLALRLGHQKAIAVGLAYTHQHLQCDQVLVMDGDGEDRPEDAALLLREAQQHPDEILVARRARREEGLLFKLFYFFYKFIFRLLTGKSISFGNFMLIPQSRLAQLVYYNETWINLAAAIIKSRLPYKTVNTSRGKRYAGQSNMNFHALMMHGLGAISVFTESITFRLLIFSSALISISILAIFSILIIKWFTPLAIPGWASVFMASMIIVLLQGFLLSFFSLFLFLSGQSQRKVLPVHHFREYLKSKGA